MTHTFDIHEVEADAISPLSDLRLVPDVLDEFYDVEGSDEPLQFADPPGENNPTGLWVQAWLVSATTYCEVAKAHRWLEARHALSNDPAGEQAQAAYADATDRMFRRSEDEVFPARSMTGARFAELLPAITDEVIRGDLGVVELALDGKPGCAYLLLTRDYVPLVEAHMEWFDSQARGDRIREIQQNAAPARPSPGSVRSEDFFENLLATADPSVVDSVQRAFARADALLEERDRPATGDEGR